MKPYSKMITIDFYRPVIETEEEIRKIVQSHRRISLYGFESESAVQDFIKLFPKYVKLKTNNCRSWKTNVNEFEGWGIKSFFIDGTYMAFGVELKIDRLTEVTGEVNETGEKRLSKFLEVLRGKGYIE